MRRTMAFEYNNVNGGDQICLYIATQMKYHTNPELKADTLYAMFT